jgi:phage baseplate assembly protein W
MYVDLNKDYTINSDPACLEDMKVIAQSLSRLFTTKIGSVPFNRGYGSNLWNLLFESATFTLNEITMLIYQDVLQWEPRITLNPSDVTLEKLDVHSYSINVTFRVPRVNNAVGNFTQKISE